MVPNQAVKGGAPGPGYTGSGYSNEGGMFTSRQKLNPYYAPCEIFGAGGEQKTPDLKEFLMGQTGETQVIHKKANYLLC